MELGTEAELKESAGPERAAKIADVGEHVLVLAKFQYVLPAALFNRDRAITAMPYVSVPEGATHTEVRELLREAYEEAVVNLLKHYDVAVETLAREQEAAPAGT